MPARHRGTASARVPRPTARRRAARAAVVPLLLLLLGPAPPARAADISTTIDLNYTYGQDMNGVVNVDASGTRQRYELRYTTLVGSDFDLQGVVSVEQSDDYTSTGGDTSRTAPTFDLNFAGPRSSARVGYTAQINRTDQYRETAASESYSNSLSSELTLSPVVWPEVKLRVQRNRDYQFQSTERTTQNLQFDMRKASGGFRGEFNFKLDNQDSALPKDSERNSLDWTGRLAYRGLLIHGAEYELSYELRQSYRTDYANGNFRSDEETYTQLFQSRIRNVLNFSSRLRGDFAWEYQIEQDLLGVKADYVFKNTYTMAFNYDMYWWLPLNLTLIRDSANTQLFPPNEDEQKVTDTVRFNLQVTRWEALRLSWRAEFQQDQTVTQDTGGTVDHLQRETYEGLASNRIGDFWDLTLSVNNTTEREQGWVTKQDSKFKAELRLKPFTDFEVAPSYDLTRITSWGFEEELLSAQSRTEEMRIRFSYRKQFWNFFNFSFGHQYALSTEQSVDQPRTFKETARITEDDEVRISIINLFPDLRIEGGVLRKATDDSDDDEKMTVEVSYALLADWQYKSFGATAGVKYDDKGDTYDNMSVNTKVGWSNANFDLSGEYQFDKVFAEEIDEVRRLNLRLGMRF